MPIACGAALAAQLEEAGGVAVCFFGDGATGEGEFHETLNIASLWKLPLLFVCENNQYGAGNAVDSVRVVADIALHAPAYGMPGVSVDGNDVLAVREAVGSAVVRARAGDGPAFVECKTVRWERHSAFSAGGADPVEQRRRWQRVDPIPRYRASVPYLAHAPIETLGNPATWRFFTGRAPNGQPKWVTHEEWVRGEAILDFFIVRTHVECFFIDSLNFTRCLQPAHHYLAHSLE
jgi:hypothetical protein